MSVLWSWAEPEKYDISRWPISGTNIFLELADLLFSHVTPCFDMWLDFVGQREAKLYSKAGSIYMYKKCHYRQNSKSHWLSLLMYTNIISPTPGQYLILQSALCARLPVRSYRVMHDSHTCSQVPLILDALQRPYLKRRILAVSTRNPFAMLLPWVRRM